MKKNRLLKLFLSLLVAGAAIYGCERILSFDHREEIAMEALFHDDKIDVTALDAAISARFSDGPADSLIQFAKSLGGTCGTSAGTITCTLPVQGMVCVAQRLMIVGDTFDNKITKIRTTSYSANC